MNKLPLVILTGPTAVGKTDLSINLAKAISGEIISADSAQVYKGFDIGSAKVTTEEMQGIRHHLIDVYDPDFSFDVTEFQRVAKEKVNEIVGRGNIPIIVGGTGFYIQALLYDIDFNDEGDSSYREELEKYVAETGDITKLYEELKEIDPESAETIHKNNVRKVIRALEYYKLHGSPISKHNKEQRVKESAYNSAYFVLTMNRDKLYERINLRVDLMKNAGLLEEVERLKEAGVTSDMTSMQAIGYKEIYEALEGKVTLDEAFENIKLNTRHFAKRQLTWFRREKDVIWVDKDEYKNNDGSINEEAILDSMIKTLKEREIIK